MFLSWRCIFKTIVQLTSDLRTRFHSFRFLIVEIVRKNGVFWDDCNNKMKVWLTNSSEEIIRTTDSFQIRACIVKTKKRPYWNMSLISVTFAQGTLPPLVTEVNAMKFLPLERITTLSFWIHYHRKLFFMCGRGRYEFLLKIALFTSSE